eukprot:scaffold108116_cov17-Prasinocladus_malaysianus.AAC.2
MGSRTLIPYQYEIGSATGTRTPTIPCLGVCATVLLEAFFGSPWQCITLFTQARQATGRL